MKEGWKMVKFEKAIQKVTYTNKINSTLYKSSGNFPIISQEKELISGYWDNVDDLFIVKKPLVIFGDHTKVVKYVNFDFVLGADGVKILLPTSDFDSKFFYYYVSSVELRNLGYARHFKLLKERKIPLPPLEEQHRIVSILDASFEKIDKLKANAEENLKNAKELFQQVLAQELKPKEGWVEKKLGEVAIVRIGPFGSLLHKKDYINGGTPLVNPIHIKDGVIYADPSYSVSDEKKKELCNYLLNNNDIIFARRGEIGRCALVTEKEQGYICGTGSLFVRFTRELNSKFMLLLFQSEKCRQYLLKKATGATMLNINSDIVMNMPICIPEVKEQNLIVQTLDALSEKCRRLETIAQQTIRECDALKQSILRQAFSGEL